MHVEFLGIARDRAGISEVEIEADTLGAVLAVLTVRFPRMAELIPSGRLHSSIAANLNADVFIERS